MITGSEYVDLTDLLDQNISAYDYFYGLPKEIQDKLKKQDIYSFNELQESAQAIRNQPSIADAPSVTTAGGIGVSFETGHLDNNGEYHL